MKNLITAALFLFATTALNAQSRWAGERLIGHYGELFDQGLWSAKDSDNYSYTGTRGAAAFVDKVCDTHNQFYNTNNNGLENYSRISNTFNAGNQLLTSTTQTWDNGSWINGDKYIYTYTAEGYTQSYTFQKWQNGWQNQNNEVRTYDAEGNLASSVIQVWANNAWVNDSRVSYGYTPAPGNLKTTEYKEVWTNNAWVAESKYKYTYTLFGEESEILFQQNNGSGLENKKMTTKQYNANNKLYESIEQVWVLSSTWLNSERISYTFDVQGNIASYTNEDWNSSLNVWEGNFRYVYTYDANNNKTISLTQKWVNSSWNNDEQGLYTYNSSNRYTNIISQKWVNNAWQNKFKFDYAYDNSGNVTFQESQAWAISSWAGDYKYVRTYTGYNHLATQLYTKWINGAYVDNSRDFYYYENYENGLTGISETKFAQTKLYPNPSGGIVNVEFAATGEEPVTMNVYNIAGDLIATQKAQSIHGDNRFTFNTQNMPKGFYTVQLKAVTAESNLKLVVN